MSGASSATPPPQGTFPVSTAPMSKLDAATLLAKPQGPRRPRELIGTGHLKRFSLGGLCSIDVGIDEAGICP